MATANANQQAILDQLQEWANGLGHLPTRAEFDASDLAKELPIWRISSALHSFDKAVARLTDPAIALLEAGPAIKMIVDWAVESKELPTPTGWKRSIANGARLPHWDAVVAATGLSVNQIQDRAHAVLGALGLVAVGKSKTRYAHRVDSAEMKRARLNAPGVAQKRSRTAEDAEIARLMRAEKQARKDAGIRQGRLQTAEDRAASAMWVGKAS